MDDEAAFKALADPTRRLLLDRLLERAGRTLTELESELPISRFGVAKHLRLLEAAHLVVSRRSGREKRHYLNPVPIQLIHDRWISKYTQVHVSALADLKTRLEEAPVTTTAPTTTQVYEIFIRATPQRVWEAITVPDFTAQYFYGCRVETTGEVGSSFRFRSADGSELWVDDTVLECDPPRRLSVSWRALWDPALAVEPASRVTWEIDERDGGYCLLTVTHDRLDDSPGTGTSVQGRGWMLVLSGLKSVVETGTGLEG